MAEQIWIDTSITQMKCQETQEKTKRQTHKDHDITS